MVRVTSTRILPQEGHREKEVLSHDYPVICALPFRTFGRTVSEMETWLLVVKSFGDVSLPLLGIIVGLCAASPTLLAHLRKVEDAVKSSPWIRRSFGVVLILFSSIYLFAYVRIQLSQSREGDPVHQQQKIIKAHVKSLAKEIRRYAAGCEKKHKDPSCAANFWMMYSDRVDKIRRQLRDEGIDTDNFYQSFNDNKGVNGKGIDVDTLRAFAADLVKLADQLPTSE